VHTLTFPILLLFGAALFANMFLLAVGTIWVVHKPPAAKSIGPVGDGFLAVNPDAFPNDFAADSKDLSTAAHGCYCGLKGWPTQRLRSSAMLHTAAIRDGYLRRSCLT
jgi:hypothetical protein